MEEVLSFLDSLEDDRQQWKIAHSLKDIVVIVLFATLAFCDEWIEIAGWAQYHEKLLRKIIKLQNGIPSHDTIQRVMASIKPETFTKLLETWKNMLNNNEGEKLKQILAIDGKTIRGNGNKNQYPLHIVSAWAKGSGVCFGQKSADSKGKEVPMIKALLDVVSVKGQIVTIDAIGTQKEIAEKIIKCKGDYVLAVKGNQRAIHDAIKEYFGEEGFLKMIKEQGGYLHTGERAHDQCEIREYYQTNNIKWLEERKYWDGLNSIGMVKTTILHDNGTESEAKRYFITSLSKNIDEFARAVRGHWAVESMHWHLDVTFREDKNHTLNKISAENMNIIRKWALTMLKTLQLGKKYSIKLKRRILSWAFEQHFDAVLAL